MEAEELALLARLLYKYRKTMGGRFRVYQRLRALYKNPRDDRLLKLAESEITSLATLGHNLPFLGLALGIVARLRSLKEKRDHPKPFVAVEDDEDMGEVVVDFKYS
jgi:hypothetical protein